MASYADPNITPSMEEYKTILQGCLSFSDACRPVLGSDALMDRRTLFESFEKTQDKIREFVSVSFNFDPTPSGWPKGGTLFASSGPCLSLASWSALLRVGVPPLQMMPDGASLVLGPFAETKGPRLPGRNPATHNIT